jgi:hypothetical protein
VKTDDSDAIAAVVEYRSPYLTAEDYAFVEANAKRLAAKPMPDHIRLRIARIWNSARDNGPARHGAATPRD